MSKEGENLWSVLTAIKSGDLDFLNAYKRRFDSFPNSIENDLLETRWISYAIQYGALDVVNWMIEEGCSLDFEDGMGYTVLHTAVESCSENKYEIIQLLIERGAAIDAYGVNGWTPIHLAAVRNDLKALKLFRDAGGDFKRPALVDEKRPPLQEALNCTGETESTAFIRRILESSDVR